MKFDNWKNKYIDLVQLKPELILPCINDEADLSVLNRKLVQYQMIFCELGSGSGNHLIELARRNPDNLYIGFELRYKRTFRTAEKAERDGITNLYIIRHSAENIQNFFSVASLSGVYVNFPDPWDKKKWHKHRLLSSTYFQTLHNLLGSNGFFAYKTDHPEYFQVTLDFLQNSNLFDITEFSFDLYSSDYIEKNIPTEFEGLFLSKKMPIHYLKAVRSRT